TIVIIYFFLRNGSIHSPAFISQPSSSQNEAAPANAAQSPIRLLAAFQGPPKVDTSGVYWTSDQYFNGGSAFERPNVFVTQTSDQFLYEHWRTGDFSYDIPLAQGSYELHLFFVAQRPEDRDLQFFRLEVNRQHFMSIDVFGDVLGVNIADERVFKDIYPDK